MRRCRKPIGIDRIASACLRCSFAASYCDHAAAASERPAPIATALPITPRAETAAADGGLSPHVGTMSVGSTWCHQANRKSKAWPALSLIPAVLYPGTVPPGTVTPRHCYPEALIPRGTVTPRHCYPQGL